MMKTLSQARSLFAKKVTPENEEAKKAFIEDIGKNYATAKNRKEEKRALETHVAAIFSAGSNEEREAMASHFQRVQSKSDLGVFLGYLALFGISLSVFYFWFGTRFLSPFLSLLFTLGSWVGFFLLASPASKITFYQVCLLITFTISSSMAFLWLFIPSIRSGFLETGLVLTIPIGSFLGLRHLLPARARKGFYTIFLVLATMVGGIFSLVLSTNSSIRSELSMTWFGSSSAILQGFLVLAFWVLTILSGRYVLRFAKEEARKKPR